MHRPFVRQGARIEQLVNLLGKGSKSFWKNAVMQLRHARGTVKAFWMSIQPLQRAPKVACSVASLSPVSGHQLREQLSLHCGVLAGYLLGKGHPSACLTIHDMDHYNPA